MAEIQMVLRLLHIRLKLCSLNMPAFTDDIIFNGKFELHLLHVMFNQYINMSATPTTITDTTREIITNNLEGPFYIQIRCAVRHSGRTAWSVRY
jgi:hypothetical protein